MHDSPVGFIGLGNMGGPMAANLAANGTALCAFDAAGTQDRAPSGAQAVGSSANIAERCETVFLSLPDGNIVHQVARELAGVESARVKRVVDTSTIGIEAARQANELLSAAGIDYIDAPVSGGRAGATGLPLPAPRPDAEVDNAWIPLAVCGAHMSGLPLNHQLTTRGARLLRAGHTAPEYRLYALDQFDPPRPGMLRDTTGGAIEIEIWAVPASELGSFVEGIPAPLGVGTVTLDDGSEVKGFLCETFAVGNAKDITAFASWRRYLDTKWDGPQQPP